MSESIKLHGKKFAFPNQSQSHWSLKPRPGGWIIAESSTGERVRLMVSESKGRVCTLLGGHAWNGDLVRVERGGTGSSASEQDLVAQFPGKVRKLLVKEGDSVTAGAPLLLVEAMKMEFSIKAPFEARVKKILVKEGQQLSPGDRFLDLEEIQGEEK